tara:strand:- start:1 stop:342 length:342 start_codon:yes stop_codon:yes gene_type:complete
MKHNLVIMSTLKPKRCNNPAMRERTIRIRNRRPLMLALMQTLDTILRFPGNPSSSRASKGPSNPLSGSPIATMPRPVILLPSLPKPVKRHAWRALTNPVMGRNLALTPMKGTT